MSVEVARALAERFLIGDSADFGPYQPEIPEEPPDIEELIPGRLYRTQLIDRRKHQADIQIFLGIEDLGGLLWEQDVRALMRISVSEKVVLPRILDGGYVPAGDTRAVAPVEGMAFVATQGGARPYGERDVRFFREHPDTAFQEFRSLLGGLAELHFVGITHPTFPAAASTSSSPRRGGPFASPGTS